MLIYCDSAVLIYWLDHVGPLQLRAEARIDALQRAGDQMAISDLTRLECRVGPLKRQDAAALREFDDFFNQPGIMRVPLAPAVFDRATQLRADWSFKTPDALHVAAAIEASCDRFLTNDARVARCTEIATEVLP